MAEYKIDFLDNDHVWIDGKQYISLKRFFENRSEIALEYITILEEADRLSKENKHLKELLKDKL